MSFRVVSKVYHAPSGPTSHGCQGSYFQERCKLADVPVMTASRSVLVIGGTQFIGRELVRRLLARGDRVAILHRGRSVIPAGASEILCDRNDTGAVRRALAGRRFDLVFDNVYDIERGTTATQVQAAAEACAGRVRRYVFMSRDRKS